MTNISHPVLTNNTKDFQSFYESLENCISASIDKKKICTQCESWYQQMNAEYELIKIASENNVCFDLNDMVRILG